MHRSSLGPFGRGRLDQWEDRLAAALLAGGNSRIEVDGQRVNKYLCPPLPTPELTCLSSCTASPISVLGLQRAASAFERIADAPKILVRSRIEDCEASIQAAIRAYLGLDQADGVILTASGTDGTLLASCLVQLERRDSRMTAILPSPSETGTGVPLAAACHTFDGPFAGRSLVDAYVTSEHVALRGLDGMPREAGAVAQDFRDTVRAVNGRAVIIFTYASKTGLVAPVEVPAGVDVIVDACQLRLPAHKVREYLRMGWPVVITGSKFLGGPAFSGAVLVPSARFSRRVRDRAVRLCALYAGLAGVGGLARLASSTDVTAPLLRWSAALAGLESAVLSEEEIAEGVRRLEREAAAGLPHFLGPT